MKILRLSVLLFPLVLAAACGAPEQAAAPGAGVILRVDPRFDGLVPADARIEKLADGFVFIEGPVWIWQESVLLFSDVRDNIIYQWTEEEGTSPFIAPVFVGDPTGLRSVSPNGLTLDGNGQLIIAEHGNRLISRLETDGTRTTLVDNYQGRRLNSPNDVVYGLDGWLYFTDPPYGLEGLEESPLRELDFNGIYRLDPVGRLEMLYAGQSRPNGIVLSPDDLTLYVANSDENLMVWYVYDIGERGLSEPRIFYDASDQTATGVPDEYQCPLHRPEQRG